MILPSTPPPTGSHHSSSAKHSSGRHSSARHASERSGRASNQHGDHSRSQPEPRRLGAGSQCRRSGGHSHDSEWLASPSRPSCSSGTHSQCLATSNPSIWSDAGSMAYRCPHDRHGIEQNPEQWRLDSLDSAFAGLLRVSCCGGRRVLVERHLQFFPTHRCGDVHMAQCCQHLSLES